MKKVLVRFDYNYELNPHETGTINSIYIMSKDEWNKIRTLQENDESIFLYDFAGKGTESYAGVDRFMLVSKNQEEIEVFRSLFGETFGTYQPFDSAMELYEESYEEEEY